jgi:hypothetical protein
MRQLKLFLDIDGILTDFDGAVHKLGDVAAEGLGDKATEMQKMTMYSAIEDAGPSFWAKMDWLPEGKVFWKFVK